MGESTDSLLQRAIDGDSRALGEILKQHGPSVRRTLAGKIPRRWRAVLSEDDVMQQTYADAVADITRFAPRESGSLRAWLITLARRNLLDAVSMLGAEKRGGKRRRIDPADHHLALAGLIDGVGETPSRHMIRTEGKAALFRAIDQLPDLYAQVVVLYDIEGWAVRDVAATLHKSAGAIFMLRVRAHDRLRRLMGTPSKYFTASS